MASVHGFNQALAKVRGVPPATIEAYSRGLRREGVLPETRRGGGGPFTSAMAGYMLAAVLRGSPTAAAENAREVGNLIVHDTIGNPSGILAGEGPSDPILNYQVAMFGWPADMSFAGMVGWLIDRHVDGTIDNFIDVSKGYKIEVDRYWVMAKLSLHPAHHLADGYIEAWRAAFKGLEMPPLPERNADGSLYRPVEITFHSSLRYEMKVSYKVDPARNRKASRQYMKLRDERGRFDVWGTESITQRTLIAIAEVFK
jgi:hypothetical protein